MSKKRRLSFDAIISSAGGGTPGVKTWFQRLPQAEQADLAGIKKAWNERGRRPPAITMARALIAHCKELGIEVAGETQVSKWLKNG